MRLAFPLMLAVILLFSAHWFKSEAMYIASNTWFAVAYLIYRAKTVSCKAEKHAQHQQLSHKAAKDSLVPTDTSKLHPT